MNNFTILGIDEVETSNVDRKCTITDFSILLGGFVSENNHTSEDNSRQDRTGRWWVVFFHNDCPFIIDERGEVYDLYLYKQRDCGARPAIPYSSIASVSSNKTRGIKGFEVEYGEYPQTIVSEDFARTLETAYSNKTINQTGKSYTTDSVSKEEWDTPFQARTHIEYEYNGKKYIRFVGDSNGAGKKLSDGRIIKNGEVYWIEVEPIKWQIDVNEIAISKKIIFAGVQYNREKDIEDDFDKTDIKKFMDKYFSKDIIPSFSINDEVKEKHSEDKKELEELKTELIQQIMDSAYSTNNEHKKK